MKDYNIFAQRIGLIGLINLLVTLSTIILIPIVTKNININEYGVWIQINALIALLPGIMSLGLNSTMVRFLAGKKKEIQEGFYSITFVTIITSFVASCLFLLFSNLISNSIFSGYIKTTQITALVIFVSSLNIIFLNYFRTFQQAKRYSFFLLLQSYLIFIIVAFFALSKLGIFYLTLGLLIGNIIVLIIMAFVILSEIRI